MTSDIQLLKRKTGAVERVQEMVLTNLEFRSSPGLYFSVYSNLADEILFLSLIISLNAAPRPHGSRTF